MFIPDALVGATGLVPSLLAGDEPFFVSLDAVVLVRVHDSRGVWAEGNVLHHGSSYLLFVDGSAVGSTTQTSRHTAQMSLSDRGWMMTLKRKDIPAVVTDEQRYGERGLIPVDLLRIGTFTTETKHSTPTTAVAGRHRL